MKVLCDIIKKLTCGMSLTDTLILLITIIAIALFAGALVKRFVLLEGFGCGDRVNTELEQRQLEVL